MRSWLDRLVALICAVLHAPVFGLLAAAILLESGTPVIFRQIRVGRYGVPFTIYRFRSMYADTDGAAITRRNESRITPLGRILRTLKLDELPQLWNVLKGDMALVGPRPEVPKFVNLAEPTWQTVLSVRPGLTDQATLRYRDEERLLEHAADVESYYRDEVLPASSA